MALTVRGLQAGRQAGRQAHKYFVYQINTSVAQDVQTENC